MHNCGDFLLSWMYENYTKAFGFYSVILSMQIHILNPIICTRRNNFMLKGSWTCMLSFSCRWKPCLIRQSVLCLVFSLEPQDPLSLRTFCGCGRIGNQHLYVMSTFAKVNCQTSLQKMNEEEDNQVTVFRYVPAFLVKMVSNELNYLQDWYSLFNIPGSIPVWLDAEYIPLYVSVVYDMIVALCFAHKFLFIVFAVWECFL